MSKSAKKLMRQAWSAAAMGQPLRASMQYIDGKAMLSVAPASRHLADTYADLCGVPSQATREDTVFAWESYADYFFGESGPLSNIIPDYSPRQGQMQMARIVERALQMSDVAAINAPTGTGKSLAYLAPALAQSADSKKPVIISTSSKTLQGQILNSDLPLLEGVFPGVTVAIVKGRTNYVCERKLRNSEIPKHVEYMIPETGLIDELQLDPEDREAIALESGTICKGCPLRSECRYQEQRREARNADVIVINHALLAVDLFKTEILPDASAYIVDEAHKLPGYLRSALASEIAVKGLDLLAARTEKHERCLSIPRILVQEFWAEVENESEEEGYIQPSTVINAGSSLAAEMIRIANILFTEEDEPRNDEEAADAALAARIRSMADNIQDVSGQPSSTECRWALLDEHQIVEGIQVAPLEVSEHMSKVIGYGEPDYRCIECRETVAEPLYVRKHRFICRHCRDGVDGLERHDGRQVDRMPNAPAWIFTSATMSVNGVLDRFCEELGVESAMQACVETPFDYESTTMLYVADDLPEPSDPQHTGLAADRIIDLVRASQGGALLLYASRRAMEEASHQVSGRLRNMGLNVMVQDEIPKEDIVDTMRTQPDCVTFGLASFREGVDIPGLNLRLVVIDKLLFEPPSPYSRNREQAMNERAAAEGYTGFALEFYAFNHIAVTDMVLEMQQAFGRLNRRTSDRGVVAIMDPRATHKRYGQRRLLPSLPPAPKVTLEVATTYLSRLAGEAVVQPSLFQYEDDLDL